MVGRRRLAECVSMATDALRGEAEAIELPDRPDFVAGIAIHNRMGTNQRKSILVLIDVVDRHLPSICVVAEFALRAVLAAVEISVAILTFLRNVAEIEVSVAIETLHNRVAPAQGKPGLRMPEFDFRSDRLPTLCRVTLLAWNLQFVPVRTASEPARLDLLTNRTTNRKNKSNKKNPRT